MIKYIKENWQGLLISILFVELIGITSSLLSGPTKSIYATYTKPPLSPPDWIFGIVWPLLYAFMGIAVYLVYKSDIQIPERRKALALFALQLFLNFMWSIIFFRFNMLWGAFVIILLLDIAVILTISTFNLINKKAVVLMLPYLFWILFATYLNAGLAFLN